MTKWDRMPRHNTLLTNEAASCAEYFFHLAQDTGWQSIFVIREA